MNAKNLVVITGATRGLGHAMAEEFARLGHTVVGCGRSQREVAQLGQKMGKPHDFAMVNVASDAEVKSWAAETLRGHGAPRLLLNNAAIINKNARLWEVSAEEFSQVIDVNIKGTVSVIRHFLPAMLKKGKGVIVNFSFRLGTLDGRGSRALLRQQVGYRRLDAVSRARVAARAGRRGVKSRNHQYRHAAELFRRLGVELSVTHAMGQNSGAIFAWARLRLGSSAPRRQPRHWRQPHHRAHRALRLRQVDLSAQLE